MCRITLRLLLERLIMHFNIKSVRVKISFTFIALILLAVCFDDSEIMLMSLFCSLFHEFVHIIYIFLCGGEISEFSLSLFGGKIQRKQNHRLSNLKEAIISLSAPVLNVFTGALLLLYDYKLCGYVNLVIGLFNILPFYDFDGGRGLVYLLSGHFSYEKLLIVLNITSVISVALVSSLSVSLLFQRTVV